MAQQTAVEWLFDQINDALIEDNLQWDKQIRTRAAEQYYNERNGK